MLPKNLRIKIGEFNRNPQRYSRIIFESFDLVIKKSPMGAKFAFSVPKAVDKRSSKRNFTKRVFEQLILKEKDNYKKAIQVLIRAKEIINKENRKRIETEFKKAINEEFSN